MLAKRGVPFFFISSWFGIQHLSRCRCYSYYCDFIRFQYLTWCAILKYFYSNSNRCSTISISIYANKIYEVTKEQTRKKRIIQFDFSFAFDSALSFPVFLSFHMNLFLKVSTPLNARAPLFPCYVGFKEELKKNFRNRLVLCVRSFHVYFFSLYKWKSENYRLCELLWKTSAAWGIQQKVSLFAFVKRTQCGNEKSAML